MFARCIVWRFEIETYFFGRFVVAGRSVLSRCMCEQVHYCVFRVSFLSMLFFFWLIAFGWTLFNTPLFLSSLYILCICGVSLCLYLVYTVCVTQMSTMRTLMVMVQLEAHLAEYNEKCTRYMMVY